jgi:hypothetical protein
MKARGVGPFPRPEIRDDHLLLHLDLSSRAGTLCVWTDRLVPLERFLCGGHACSLGGRIVFQRGVLSVVGGGRVSDWNA